MQERLEMSNTRNSWVRAGFMFVIAGCFPHASLSADEMNPALEPMIEFMEFTEYQGGNLLPEQIPAGDYASLFIIDGRRAEDFASDHIPGAINIEWRQVLAQREDIPRDKTVLIYCNTGSLSAQAAFALKVIGYSNVKVLTGGFNTWKAKGGVNAHERATNPRL